MTTKSKKATKTKEFNSIDEIVEYYLPDDVEKERPLPGDFGKRLAEDTVEKVKKILLEQSKKSS
jgi:hypothetical protein